MPFAVTLAADLGLTSTTLAVLSSVLLMHAPGLDPFATPSGGTINTIFGRVLLEFLVPGLFEVDIKQPFDMLKRNVVRSTTFRRHMLWVSH